MRMRTGAGRGERRRGRRVVGLGEGRGRLGTELGEDIEVGEDEDEKL